MSKPIFSAEHFYRFCDGLFVDTKEYGIVPLGKKLYAGQKYLIESIEAALRDEDIHTFVILKGRQMGITTVMLALDLYWSGRYPGTQGSLVANDESNKEMFRNTLKMYMRGVSKEWRVPASAHNRYELAFKNRSRFIYQVAGERKNSSLGKGKALNFCHATEVGAYGDPEGIASLQSSFAEKHPLRLFLYESTAQGFNLFYDMWETAKKAVTQKAIFIGWWQKEDYSVADDDPVFKVYGYKGLSDYEKKAVRLVKKFYGYEPTLNQIAWYRWKLNDEIQDDSLMRQNFPWHEEEAFIMSGSNIFSPDLLTDMYKQALKAKPDCYQFVFMNRFEDTDVRACHERNASLKIWEYPASGAVYSLGADPAYGVSENNDRSAIQVFRCYAERIVQVAEFCSPTCDVHQFAWICAYLGGAYGVASGAKSMLNLEINGPGQAVKAELNNMRRNAEQAGGISKGMRDWMGCIRPFIFRRVDSVNKGFMIDTKTTNDTKERMIGSLNKAMALGACDIRSKETLDEMKTVVREDGSITHGSHTHDDRVMAMALAAWAWDDILRMEAYRAHQIFNAPTETPLQHKGHELVQGFLKRRGLG